MTKRREPIFSYSVRSSDAFSLVELMIAVAIVGILSALAATRFQDFTTKAKQTEAKVNLNAMIALQEGFHADNDRYGLVPEIGFSVQGARRYDYSISVGGGTWRGAASELTGARGVCRKGTILDQWIIHGNTKRLEAFCNCISSSGTSCGCALDAAGVLSGTCAI